MNSRFFIERPVFAAVMSIVIVLAGLMALRILPIAQYPEIAPPTVTITATYPGASAETLATTVAAPIEEQLSGVENLLYFQSSSSSNGQTTITATFEVGTDVDKATFNINNRVQLATPRLPDGTPFPTTYYLTCPKAVAGCSTLEARGVMAEMTQRLAEEIGRAHV